MGRNRTWTQPEREYLCENWGTVSIGTMAKILNRSEAAVILKASKMGLGAFLDSGDYVTLNQLHLALYGTHFSTYQAESWIRSRGLPVHTKRVRGSSFRVVRIDEFWRWAEKNRTFIDFSRMEPLSLGIEPPWVEVQRKKDARAFHTQRKDPWTPLDDERLRYLLQKQCYTWPELSRMLQRSEGAIQRRCCDLGINDRPVKMATHGGTSVWLSEHFQILTDGIRNGDGYAAMAQRIGKSEKAVRGKVYTTYFTENLDSVRELMGSGKFGDGAGAPTVKQANKLSAYRTDTRNLMERLDAALKKRILDLDENQFWQSRICENYSARCSAEGRDCDICSEFVRMQPKYCARCGATFFEKSGNRFCPGCRLARKKKAQRHYRRQQNLRRINL